MSPWHAYFKRPPSSPPGLERIILRQMPATLSLGALALALPSVLLRALDALQPGIVEVRAIQGTDFLAIGLLSLLVVMVVTATIGAVMVVVMKGPVCSADSYPLVDADRPPGTPAARPRG